jgi:hypothetical protein
MHERFLNQRIAILHDRYIWWGLATEVVGPCIYLKDKILVIRHTKNDVLEWVEWGDGFVNVERAEDVSLEDGIGWVNATTKKRCGVPERKE